MKLTSRFALSLGLAALAASALAAAPAHAAPPVKVSVEVKKITTVDGKEVASVVQRAAPGDTLEYVATYRAGENPPQSLTAELPIPAGTVFVPGSAKGQGPMLAAASSTERCQVTPLKRWVTTPKGKQEVEVAATEYRKVCWALPDFAHNNPVNVSIRVKLPGGVTPSVTHSSSNARG